jgi:hypothetical protein
MSRNQSLLRYGRCLCDLYSRCSVWFPCISTQLSAHHTQGHTLLNLPGLTQLYWQTFSTRCCNTSNSLVGAEYTKDFTCPHSQKSRVLRSEDHQDQLIAPPRPLHCSSKVCFRCCLTVRRKWGGVPSFMNHMCCWWRSTRSKSTGKSLVRKTMVYCTCSSVR